MAIEEDSVRKLLVQSLRSDCVQLVREEMKRLFPEFVNDLYQRLERKMEEKLEHVIPQILNRFENIMHQQANGVIAHNSQLPRSMPTEDVQPASDLQLAFTKKLLLPSFSEDAIKDEDHNHLQVSLEQFKHDQRCVFPLHSPIEVEIVVLDGGFPREKSQDWNTDEFNSSILEKRENKRSLLLGESKAPLSQGIASFGTLKLTDNSSRVRTGKFRLGVRVSPGSYKGPRIKEAITESFLVLDHRSKFNQKSHPPSLDHEVWRLVNIGRNGAFQRRLDVAGIKTVQDFLKLSVVDQQHLRKTIKMSDKKWEETIGHARTCRLGDDLYLYDKPPFTVKLNPICEVVEVRKNGVSIALTQLASEETVQHATEAYQNWNRLERVPGTPSMIGAQKQNSIKKCGLESDEPRCSNPLDGSQRELSAGNVTPPLGASVCVLEQLPSPQRAGAENQNWNPSDSDGGTMEAQQQSDHFGDLGRSAALWSPSSQLAWSPNMFCGTGESPGETIIGDIWQ
ncbi:protein SAR DEFICIENT 1-like [Musa acuminata AAA Group]|uniref:protein SAR DEFICIENT 1-like n=1 Tax=Musa acuminata AAA Group TaxID=214697 RepID=UPI0008A09FAE|nr:PREDICTED: protein SAR DEFICIENT 1-like isoform X2 [Musa acuminata subsp. malaccensis]